MQHGKSVQNFACNDQGKQLLDTKCGESLRHALSCCLFHGLHLKVALKPSSSRTAGASKMAVTPEYGICQ